MVVIPEKMSTAPLKTLKSPSGITKRAKTKVCTKVNREVTASLNLSAIQPVTGSPGRPSMILMVEKTMMFTVSATAAMNVCTKPVTCVLSANSDDTNCSLNIIK
jgi:hypothetical protein